MPDQHADADEGSAARIAAKDRAATRRPRRALVLGGVAAALALGVGLGLLARPELTGGAAAPPTAAGVPIRTLPAARAAPAPDAGGRLETLPPQTAVAGEDVAPAAPAAPAQPATSPALAPRHQTSVDCGAARPGAEQMVCSDPELAAADRRMTRAYRRALRAGADPAELRQDQRRWEAAREDAARYSVDAVAEVYDQRTRELDDIAGEAPASPDPED